MKPYWNVDPYVLARRSLIPSRLDVDLVRRSLAVARTDPGTLRTRQGRVDWQEACERVKEYARDLRGSLRGIGLGMYCANVLRLRQKQPATTTAMSRQLELLQQAVQLGTMRREQREFTLASLATGFHGFNAALPALTGADPIFGTFDGLGAWKEAVDALMAASEAPEVVGRWNEDAIVARAWESWHERLTAHLLGDRVDGLEAANLLAPATPILEPLTLPLEDMTLAQWTALLHAAVGGTVQDDPVIPREASWPALPALVKLGFPIVARTFAEAMRAAVRDLPEIEVPRHFAAMTRTLSLLSDAPSPARRILVVSSDDKGPNLWKPDPEHAALVGERQRLAGLFAGLSLISRDLPGAFGFDAVMLEVPAAATPMRTRADARKALGRYTELANLIDTRCVYLLREKTRDAGLLQGLRFIVNAPSLRDAISTDST